MQTKRNRAAVFALVGPGAKERERLADLLDSLLDHEPDLAQLVLVDDGNRGNGLYETVPRVWHGRATIVPHPRIGKGDGYWGGAIVGTMAALGTLSGRSDIEFALKLDTDSLVIAPFAEKLAEKFRQNPNTGQLGCYDRSADGQDRTRAWRKWTRTIRKLQMPLRFWRKHPSRRWGAEQALFGRPATFRGHLREALRNGYQPGEFCQGGGYAVSVEMLNRMANAGYLSDPLLWLHLPLGEDVAVSLYVRAVGMHIAGCVDEGDAFGISVFHGIPYPPEELLSRGYSVIHSIKNDGRYSEEHIRDYFRTRRARQHAAAGTSS